jgi:hypothetical protein
MERDMKDQLLFCDCGHGLTLHGIDGCRGRKCSCWFTRSQAIGRALEEIERESFAIQRTEQVEATAGELFASAG